MKIQRIRALYWSATGNTKKVVRYMAHCFSLPVLEQDFTLPDARKESIVCSKEELVLIGLPTYAGKLPNKIMPFVKEKIQGNSTLAVPVVTFGNRNFDHSLAELCALLKDNHFIPVGACALSCQHAFSSRLAYDRPNESDWEELDHFLMNVQKKLDQGPPFDFVVPGDAKAPYYVPKKEDGSPARFLKAKPIVDKVLCTQCRVCAHLCPMGSIDIMDPSLTPGVCIKCQRCIRQCPQKARTFQDSDFLSHVKMLEAHYTNPRANRFFF